MSNLFDTGSKGLKFPTIGTTHTGTITSEPRERQQTEYGTGKPAVWPSGEPKMQILVDLQTEEKDDPDDDGERTLYVSSNSMKHAIGKAIRDAGAKDLEVGGTLTVTYTGNDPQSKNPQNPKKLYQATYVRPASPFAQADTPTIGQPAGYAAPQPVTPLAQTQATSAATYQQAVSSAPQAAPQAPLPAAPQPVNITGKDDQVLQLLAAKLPAATITSALGVTAEQVQQVAALNQVAVAA